MAWVYYTKIPIYPIFYLLKGDYTYILNPELRVCRAPQGLGSASDVPAHLKPPSPVIRVSRV